VRRKHRSVSMWDSTVAGVDDLIRYKIRNGGVWRTRSMELDRLVAHERYRHGLAPRIHAPTERVSKAEELPTPRYSPKTLPLRVKA